MRRLRNLALFGIISLALIVGLGYAFRDSLLPLMGINLDGGGGGRAQLVLPDGYTATVFAEGLIGPRFMAVSPDGVLHVAERGADRVVALPDADSDGAADGVVVIGTRYGHAHDIEFEAEGSLLIAGEESLYRVTLDEGVEIARETVVDGLPTGGHSTKTVEVREGGEILLSIGSSCDACVEVDDRRAAITAMAPDGTDQRIAMRGLRNAVGLWVDDETGRVWATTMGRDRLGDDRPPETLYEVVEGADAGWPRCHAGEIRDREFGTDENACDGVVMPAATFPAHMAPLALVEWDGHLVICFHGSWNSSTKVGYALWWLPWDGAPAGTAEAFATGFLPDGGGDALGRPAGLAVGSDGALYVSDDKSGFIYRITASDPAAQR